MYQLEQILRMLGKNRGLDTYGPRHDSLGVKGTGYFGPLKANDGYSTEISMSDGVGLNSRDFPTMVPTLSLDELKHLLQGGDVTDSIYDKARSWADFRQSRGESPFDSGYGLKYPVPQGLDTLFGN